MYESKKSTLPSKNGTQMKGQIPKPKAAPSFLGNPIASCSMNLMNYQTAPLSSSFYYSSFTFEFLPAQSFFFFYFPSHWVFPKRNALCTGFKYRLILWVYVASVSGWLLTNFYLNAGNFIYIKEF